MNWDPVRRFGKATRPYLDSLEMRLDQLLGKSDQRLAPLTDPLRADFGIHRWLRSEREEAYSDWLAWVLENLSYRDVLDVLRLPVPPQKEPPAAEGFKVIRESHVPAEGLKQRGRTDIVIRASGAGTILLEVKRGSADEADLSSLPHYRRFYKPSHPLLLATEGKDPPYEGYELREWRPVCLALRRIVPRLVSENKIVVAAMTLGFVGAVEQNLLGLRHSAEVGGLSSAADYLEEWIDGGGNMAQRDADQDVTLLADGIRLYAPAFARLRDLQVAVTAKCEAILKRHRAQLEEALRVRINNIKREAGVLSPKDREWEQDLWIGASAIIGVRNFHSVGLGLYWHRGDNGGHNQAGLDAYAGVYAPDYTKFRNLRGLLPASSSFEVDAKGYGLEIYKEIPQEWSSWYDVVNETLEQLIPEWKKLLPRSRS